MLRKFFFIIALIFVLFLIIMAIMPKLFTNKSPVDQYIHYLPPNNGINKIEIENNSNESLLIDSLIIDIKPKTIEIISNSIIKPRSTCAYIFKITDFSTLLNRNMTFRLFAQHSQNIFKVKLNNIDHVDGFWKKDHYYFFSIGSIDYNSNINKDNKILMKSFLGTDNIGRDIWTRMVYGSRIIMQILLFSLLISVPLGVVTGLFRGYYNNIISNIIGYISGFANTISIYLLTMLVLLLFKQEIIYIVIAFSLIQWVEIEKLIYVKVKNLKESNFIVSARLFGKSHLDIIFSDIIIMCYPQIIIGSVFLAKRIILIESSLSFLGFSVTIPYSSWGAIISSVKDEIYFKSSLNIFLPPVILIVTTLLSFNIIENYIIKWWKNVNY